MGPSDPLGRKGPYSFLRFSTVAFAVCMSELAVFGSTPLGTYFRLESGPAIQYAIVHAAKYAPVALEWFPSGSHSSSLG